MADSAKTIARIEHEIQQRKTSISSFRPPEHDLENALDTQSVVDAGFHSLVSKHELVVQPSPFSANFELVDELTGTQEVCFVPSHQRRTT